MGKLVADIEWSAPLPALSLGEASGVLALVRWNGRPIGLVHVNAFEGIIAPAMLRAAILAQVSLSDLPDVEPVALIQPASIVVCTRDRSDLLRTCLEALRPHAVQGHQVIIVDNAPSDDATALLVGQYPYRYICEPTPGLNVARNRGVAAAQHDIVAFTDDDCSPDPAWLRALTAPFADPLVGATTGLVMPLELETPAQERFEAYSANRRVFRRRFLRAPQTPPSTAGIAGMGANMAFRRERLERLGGFDPRFDGGTPTLSGGDTELFARILDAGGTIAYRPDALVWHRHQREIADVRRVVFGYGVGVSAVLWKRFRENADRRALVTAVRWLAGPPLKAVWNRLRARPAASADLVALEALGFLHGPARLRAARHALAAERRIA